MQQNQQMRDRLQVSHLALVVMVGLYGPAFLWAQNVAYVIDPGRLLILALLGVMVSCGASRLSGGVMGWGVWRGNRDSTNLEVFKAFEIRESLLSSDPIAMCELLVGLPDVTVLDVTEVGDRLRVTVETRGGGRRVRECGSPVVVKDRDTVELTDLPCFGCRRCWRGARSAGVLARVWVVHRTAPGIAAPG
jgi:hypothetical protein